MKRLNCVRAQKTPEAHPGIETSLEEICEI